MRRAFFEARTHTLLFHAHWVARSSVCSRVARRLPGRGSSVAARPLRCRSGLFGWGAGAREGRHLVSSGGLLPAGTGVDTSLEQYVVRINHDRTTVRQRQSPIFAGGLLGNTAAVNATSPRAVAVR